MPPVSHCLPSVHVKVEKSLKPKLEYILKVPLTAMQVVATNMYSHSRSLLPTIS